MSDMYDDDEDRLVVAATLRRNGGEIRISYTLEGGSAPEKIEGALRAATDGVVATIPMVFASLRDHDEPLEEDDDDEEVDLTQ